MGTAMTIGVGYLGTRSIILGSDMELTGVAKYAGIKDYFTVFADQGVLAVVYSGNEDDMRCIWEGLEEKIETGKQAGVLVAGDIRQYVTEVLASVITDKKSQFQMLVAIAHDGENPIFLRTFGKRVSPATGWEIIGRGDCELTRYLTGLMNHPALTDYQSALWTTHIINAANSFVQGVGQGIRLSIIYPEGQIQYMDGDIFANKMAEADSYVAGMWFDFCNKPLPEEQVKFRFQTFAAKMEDLHRRIPLVIRN